MSFNITALIYRKMMINQDTACMFACCYDDNEGRGEGKHSLTLISADMACLAGTAKVSNFIIITSGKHAAPVLVYHHLSVLLEE